MAEYVWSFFIIISRGRHFRATSRAHHASRYATFVNATSQFICSVVIGTIMPMADGASKLMWFIGMLGRKCRLAISAFMLKLLLPFFGLALSSIIDETLGYLLKDAET